MQAVAHIGHGISCIMSAGPSVEATDDFPIELLMVLIADAANIIREVSVTPAGLIVKMNVDFAECIRVAPGIVAGAGTGHFRNPILFGNLPVLGQIIE
jgi:hypothetical protein